MTRHCLVGIFDLLSYTNKEQATGAERGGRAGTRTGRDKDNIEPDFVLDCNILQQMC